MAGQTRRGANDMSMSGQYHVLTSPRGPTGTRADRGRGADPRRVASVMGAGAGRPRHGSGACAASVGDPKSDIVRLASTASGGAAVSFTVAGASRRVSHRPRKLAKPSAVATQASATDVTQPRVLAFEGVDGAGKSTVIHLVAEHLRARGIPVFLPRVGKEHDSRPTKMIRRLTRDQRNLDLLPEAELALYCAREAQVLGELVEPALARGETVLLDRSMLTPVVLGSFGRGLPRRDCEAMARAAARGRDPDLTFVFDVHPRTSRIRKRLDKVRHHAFRDGGRKGLMGSALKERVRQGYLELARERGYPLFHVERISPTELGQRVVAVLEGAPIDEGIDDGTPAWLVPEDWTLEQALEHLPRPMALYFARGLVAGRDLRRQAAGDEPQIVAWSLDRLDPLRDEMAGIDPVYALRGLVRCPLERDDLRDQYAEIAPQAVALALRFVGGERADRLRERLATRVPGAVVESLVGRDDEWAWALRRRLWKDADHHERASGLVHCRSREAAREREELLKKHPVQGLASLRGAPPDEADPWLRRYVDFAAKTVLRALMGRHDATAVELRERLSDAGREVVDSIRGLDDPASWRLRESVLNRWPSTVAWSLAGLPSSPRAQALLARCKAAAPGDVHLLRRLRDLEEYPLLPSWARLREEDEE
ncbi:MAG: thymidylate kinase [Myxococcales bacterium FL481]|nr:MAG: thymidylate kinase [Myxococcales bacterium FL481]